VEQRNYFLSDNASGVHPEVLAALAEANRGHAAAYGHDAYTERASSILRKHFGNRAEVLLALTGTGANVIALQSVLRSHDAVVCADCAHMHRDECGAPEKFTGSKLIPAPTAHGKLSPDSIRPLLEDTNMVHRVRPKLVSISQCTELGTVYTVAELRTLSDFCHANGLLLHMDGARLSNAAVALGVSLAATSADCGVDILSFGGTKNGLMAAEAILFFDPRLAETAAFARKQAMQLCSKMRFVAVQFQTLLDGDLWRRSAAHANAMAARLAAAIDGAVEVVMPVETNAVFARMPPAAIAELQSSFVFGVWDSAQSIVRWMTSFDTGADEVDQFAARIRHVSRHARWE
jgi:threonine aldolase